MLLLVVQERVQECTTEPSFITPFAADWPWALACDALMHPIAGTILIHRSKSVSSERRSPRLGSALPSGHQGFRPFNSMAPPS